VVGGKLLKRSRWNKPIMGGGKEVSPRHGVANDHNRLGNKKKTLGKNQVWVRAHELRGQESDESKNDGGGPDVSRETPSETTRREVVAAEGTWDLYWFRGEKKKKKKKKKKRKKKNVRPSKADLTSF